MNSKSLKLLKQRIAISRVGIAYAVLRGYSVMFRITVVDGEVRLNGPSRIRDCVIRRTKVA